MNLTDDTWHIVNDTPKVTGFVGGGEQPTPLGDEEVARMTQQIKDGAVKPEAEDPVRGGRERQGDRAGRSPISPASWTRCSPEKEKVRVMVQVFGSGHSGHARLHEGGEGLKARPVAE